MSRIRGPYVRFCERDEAETPHPTRLRSFLRWGEPYISLTRCSNGVLPPFSRGLLLCHHTPMACSTDDNHKENGDEQQAYSNDHR